MPNQVAERLTGRDYLSYSAINTFRACPLRFKFRYLDGLPEESVSASLVFGSAIHRAAELQFNRLLAGEPPPSLDELLVAYHDAWRDQVEWKVQFAKGDDLASLTQLATRMLDVFRTSAVAQPAGTVLGIEEELRGSIIPGVPDLLGRIDLLVETDDAVVITDLKTSRSRWTREQAEDASEQLLLYSELVKAPGARQAAQDAVRGLDQDQRAGDRCPRTAGRAPAGGSYQAGRRTRLAFHRERTILSGAVAHQLRQLSLPQTVPALELVESQPGKLASTPGWTQQMSPGRVYAACLRSRPMEGRQASERVRRAASGLESYHRTFEWPGPYCGRLLAAPLLA